MNKKQLMREIATTQSAIYTLQQSKYNGYTHKHTQERKLEIYDKLKAKVSLLKHKLTKVKQI